MDTMDTPKQPPDTQVPESSPDPQAQVPSDYVNPCKICNSTFCSQECEDSYVRITGTPLAITPMQSYDIQYETNTHPMSKDLYDSLSNVRGFTNMNGATYEAYVANWEMRRQSGCIGN